MEIFKVLGISAAISLGVSLLGLLVAHLAVEPLEQLRRHRLANSAAHTPARVSGR